MSSLGYNLARFDFVSVRLAVLCAQTGSLTMAARQCNLVLPAASRRLKELEVAVGCLLFDRHSRGLTMTPAGQIFMRRGLALLHEMDGMVLELADLQKGVARHLRLFSGTAAINQFLPPLLAKYTTMHPEVQIDLEEQVSQQVVLALREGGADVGVFVEGPNTDGLEICEFRQDELVLILPTGHDLVGKTPISFSETLDETWISLNPAAALLQQQQIAAVSLGKQLKLRMQVHSFDAVGHMVASGLGIALLPKAAALPIVRSMKLSWRPLKDEWARRKLKVGVRKDADQIVMQFRDFLHKPSQNAKAN